MATSVLDDQEPHVLVVTFAVQGHLNPALQFSNRLLLLGCRVTLLTTVSGHRRMMMANNNVLPDGLSIATFEDDNLGSSSSSKLSSHDADHNSKWWDQFIRKGSLFLGELIDTKAKEGNPFTCLVYTLLLTWVAQVAREHNLRSTLLWIQPAVVLDIFYCFFNGYREVLENCNKDPSFCIDLPGLPVNSFKAKDLPSFLAPSNPYPWIFLKLEEQINILTRQSKPTILVNTFDQLEPESLRTLRDKLDIFAIGPLIPSSNFLKTKEKSGNHDEYMGWLDLQAKASVVYVSFGTIAAISKEQKEEVGKGLLRSGRPFLWVIRKEEEEEGEEMVRWRNDMETKTTGLGRIVEWCSQVEVLSHSSVGCFVTHCGWNSTMESICLGVPMVTFPQFADQGTNAKLVEDVWRIGVRVVVEDGVEVVDGVEIGRCLDLVMGEGEVRDEVRMNAMKWKELAWVAAAEGGSSHINLKAFVDDQKRQDRSRPT